MKFLHPSVTPDQKTLHFTPLGLGLLYLSTVVATTLLVTYVQPLIRPKAATVSAVSSPASATPVWGELVEQDIDLAQPEEYVAFEPTTGRIETWNLPGTVDDVRKTLTDCGLDTAQVDRALSPALVAVSGSSIAIKPDDDLVFSLSPETRAKFYAVLGQTPGNRYMQSPYHFFGDSVEAFFHESNVSSSIVSEVKRLVYKRASTLLFSDLEVVLNHIDSQREKLSFLKALTRQRAVLANLRITKNTDIDKILGYWTAPPAVHIKDLRPFLNSVRRSGNESLLPLTFLLPPLVKAKLYTFAMPTKPGDVQMDCHWTALNFFQETPDDRFADFSFTSQYVNTHYYQIAKPSLVGDLIFLLDQNGQVIHSAVYLADDLIFTKNGVNYAQPWIMMHMKDLVSVYTDTYEPKVWFYRSKDL